MSVTVTFRTSAINRAKELAEDIHGLNHTLARKLEELDLCLQGRVDRKGLLTEFETTSDPITRKALVARHGWSNAYEFTPEVCTRARDACCVLTSPTGEVTWISTSWLIAYNLT